MTLEFSCIDHEELWHARTNYHVAVLSWRWIFGQMPGLAWLDPRRTNKYWSLSNADTSGVALMIMPRPKCTFSPSSSILPRSCAILLRIASRTIPGYEITEAHLTLNPSSVGLLYDHINSNFSPERRSGVSFPTSQNTSLFKVFPKVLKHFNMGCGFSKIAGETSVGTDNNQDQPARTRKPSSKMEIRPDAGQLVADHPIDHATTKHSKMTNQQIAAELIGSPDRYFEGQGIGLGGYGP